MTYQEAINHIRKHNEAHQRKEHFAVYITEALNMSIQALEKQKPKQVKRERYQYPCCPNCQKPFYPYQFHPEYCCRCGQALDWSEE